MTSESRSTNPSVHNERAIEAVAPSVLTGATEKQHHDVNLQLLKFINDNWDEPIVKRRKRSTLQKGSRVNVIASSRVGSRYSNPPLYTDGIVVNVRHGPWRLIACSSDNGNDNDKDRAAPISALYAVQLRSSRRYYPASQLQSISIESGDSDAQLKVLGEMAVVTAASLMGKAVRIISQSSSSSEPNEINVPQKYTGLIGTITKVETMQHLAINGVRLEVTVGKDSITAGANSVVLLSLDGLVPMGSEILVDDGLGGGGTVSRPHTCVASSLSIHPNVHLYITPLFPSRPLHPLLDTKGCVVLFSSSFNTTAPTQWLKNVDGSLPDASIRSQPPQPGQPGIVSKFITIPHNQYVSVSQQGVISSHHIQRVEVILPSGGVVLVLPSDLRVVDDDTIFQTLVEANLDSIEDPSSEAMQASQVAPADVSCHDPSSAAGASNRKRPSLLGPSWRKPRVSSDALKAPSDPRDYDALLNADDDFSQYNAANTMSILGDKRTASAAFAPAISAHPSPISTRPTARLLQPPLASLSHMPRMPLMGYNMLKGPMGGRIVPAPDGSELVGTMVRIKHDAVSPTGVGFLASFCGFVGRIVGLHWRTVAGVKQLSLEVEVAVRDSESSAGKQNAAKRDRAQDKQLSSPQGLILPFNFARQNLLNQMQEVPPVTSSGSVGTHGSSGGDDDDEDEDGGKFKTCLQWPQSLLVVGQGEEAGVDGVEFVHRDAGGGEEIRVVLGTLRRADGTQPASQQHERGVKKRKVDDPVRPSPSKIVPSLEGIVPPLNPRHVHVPPPAPTQLLSTNLTLTLVSSPKIGTPGSLPALPRAAQGGVVALRKDSDASLDLSTVGVALKETCKLSAATTHQEKAIDPKHSTPPAAALAVSRIVNPEPASTAAVSAIQKEAPTTTEAAVPIQAQHSSKLGESTMGAHGALLEKLVERGANGGLARGSVEIIPSAPQPAVRDSGLQDKATGEKAKETGKGDAETRGGVLKKPNRAHAPVVLPPPPPPPPPPVILPRKRGRPKGYIQTLKEPDSAKPNRVPPKKQLAQSYAQIGVIEEEADLAQAVAAAAAAVETGVEVYIVDAILGHKFTSQPRALKKTNVLVKWSGYPNPSWHPATDFLANEIFREYAGLHVELQRLMGISR